MAAGVKEGKKVLFVSEKMAELDVVKRRMDAIGLGEICFELHSHKANKRHVLEDLKRTLDLTSPIVVNVERVANDLKRRRDTLNLHCQLLHERAQPSGLTPYRVIGELVALRARGVPPADFALNGADQWTDEEVREKQNLLEDVVGRIEEIGTPNKHPWRGVGLEVALPNDIDRLAAHVGEILPQLERFVELTTGLAEFCKTDLAVTAEDAFQLARFGKRIAALPTLDRRNFPRPVAGGGPGGDRAGNGEGVRHGQVRLRQAHCDLPGDQTQARQYVCEEYAGEVQLLLRSLGALDRCGGAAHCCGDRQGCCHPGVLLCSERKYSNPWWHGIYLGV